MLGRAQLFLSSLSNPHMLSWRPGAGHQTGIKTKEELKLDPEAEPTGNLMPSRHTGNSGQWKEVVRRYGHLHVTDKHTFLECSSP